MSTVPKPMGVGGASVEVLATTEHGGAHEAVAGTGATAAITPTVDTVNKLRSHWTTPSAPACVVIQWFMRSVEARLWAIYCGTYASSSTVAILPDAGLDRIVCESEKLWLQVDSRGIGIRLMFVGSVTRTPATTSLKLCELWGETFYVEGAGHAKPTGATGDRWIPAWTVPLTAAPKVPIVNKLGKSKPEKATKQLVLQSVPIIAPFEFSFTQGNKTNKVKTSLTLNRFVGSYDGADRVPLVRPRSDDPFPDKAQISAQLEARKKVIANAANQKQNKKGTSTTAEPFKHMFR